MIVIQFQSAVLQVDIYSKHKLDALVRTPLEDVMGSADTSSEGGPPSEKLGTMDSRCFKPRQTRLFPMMGYTTLITQ